MDIHIQYDPNEWARKFHVSPNRHCCLAGGLGSGKSYAAIQELKALALENPGFTYFIGRKTMPSLRDTTMKTFFACMEDGLIPRGGHNKTNNNVTLVNGAQFIFRPLDDLEKLKSLEIAGFFVDEANEIDADTYNTLKSRVRQKVKGKEPSMYRTIIALNPGEEDHWIPQLFLHVKPLSHEMFQSTTMDNLKNLPEGYVEELKATFSQDMQQRMIFGLFGRVHKGSAVFPQFSRGNFIHPVQYDPNKILIRSWDFGYNHPVCVWAQMENTQIRYLAELMGNEVYLQDFIRNQVMPYQSSLFGDVSLKPMDFCDPRGSDESDKGKSSVQILNEHGIYPIYRRTWIEEGLKVLKELMDTKIKGTEEPNLLVHPRCKILIEGFKGGYHRSQGSEIPEKDGYYDNVMDATRYLALHCVQRAKVNMMTRTVNENMKAYVSKAGRRVEF